MLYKSDFFGVFELYKHHYDDNGRNIFYGEVTRDFVHYGKDEDVDLKKCLELGIPAYKIREVGGPFLSVAGDIGMIIVWKDNKQGTLLLSDLARDLRLKKALDAQFVDNDLIVDGKKVAGLCTQKLRNGKFAAMISFSINIDTATIAAVCKKKSKKVPGALKDSRISTEWLDQWIKEYFIDEEYVKMTYGETLIEN